MNKISAIFINYNPVPINHSISYSDHIYLFMQIRLSGTLMVDGFIPTLSGRNMAWPLKFLPMFINLLYLLNDLKG